MPAVDPTRETAQPGQRRQPPSAVVVVLALCACRAVFALCACRAVPAEWPAKSAASPAAEAAPTALVTRALDGPPPLPGDDASGWVGLQDPSAPAAHEHAAPAGGAVRYVCPMHLEVVADQMGACPRCGMGLVKRDAKR